MAAPPEPKRNRDINSLEPYVAERVRTVMEAMRARHMDPVIFEAARTHERQTWLYGKGRSHHLTQKPITWTMDSRHIVGKAVDIISKTRLWSHPRFYVALAEEGRRVGLHPLRVERCHLEYRG